MKILILGFTKLKYMPYINLYLPNIDINNNEVHVVYWNRDLNTEDLSAFSGLILHEFRYYQEDDVAKYKKISSFIQYRKFVNRIIDSYTFDKYIILHTLPGVVLYDKFCRLRGKFILDYRDSTYEGFAPFKRMVGNLVKWSAATFVSSDGFRKYLPHSESYKTYTVHNILRESLSHQEDREKGLIPSDKIRLAFWGFIRHEEINKQLIKQISQDLRFELHYYGREQKVAETLKSYVNNLNASNIYFHGEYKPEDRYTFILHTDCIHNIYYDDNMMLAMGNKYYDGIVFRIPQVCMSGSFMGKMCKKYKTGIELNPYESTFTEALYSYLSNIGNTGFIDKCNNEVERILKEQNSSIQAIKNLLS